jgi:hypothetical protein
MRGWHTDWSATVLLTLAFPVSAQSSSQATWVEEAKLLDPTGASSNANFGWAVAVSGSRALVGAPYHGNLNDGLAFVFVRDEGGWRFEATLLPSGLPSEAQFGQTVALSGNLAIVGAPYEAIGSGRRGAAYVFEREANGAWVELQRITSTLSENGDNLPLSLAIRGDTALLTGRTQFAAPGRIFQAEEEGFVESDSIGEIGVFGFVLSCALTEDFAILGMPADYPGPFEHAGAALLFDRLPGGAFSPQTLIVPDDTHIGQRFGSSVALLGTTAFIGAEGDNTQGTDAGAAYVYAREANGTWVQVQKLWPAGGGAPYRSFGASASASIGRIVVGAPHKFASGPESGSAHVFQLAAGAGWVETARILPAAAQPGDHFGFSVALHHDTLVAGAPRDGENGPRAGAAYVYRLQTVNRSSALRR